MSEIKELIERLCPDGVEYKRIDSLFETFSGMTGVSDKWKETGNCRFIDYLNVYNNMRVDVKNLPYATVKNPQQNTLQKGDILLTCASETPDECAMSSVIRDDINEGIFLDDHLFAIRLKGEHKDIVNTAFLNYYMHSSAFRIQVCKKVRGVTRFYITGKPFMSLEIPVPPIEVQRKIVEILDNFTELEAELERKLEAELEARRKQYEYYRNQLLTFDKVGGARFDVKWMTLGEIGEMIKGSGIQKSDFVEDGYPCIHYGQLHTFFGTFAGKNKSFIKKDLYDRCKKAVYGDLIIASTSEDVEACCKATAWLGGEVAISGDAHIFHHNQNPKYIAYFFQTDDFAKQKRKYASGVKVVRVSSDNLAKIVIPIPSMEEQERIVSILDRFEALTTDLQSGLPAEIEARRKQYEYYREKLLTFKRKTA